MYVFQQVKQIKVIEHMSSPSNDNNGAYSATRQNDINYKFGDTSINNLHGAKTTLDKRITENCSE